MSDNRQWWKAWNSILHDAKFQNIQLEDIGFWTLLMSLVNEQGERGKLTIIPPATITLSLLRCASMDDFKSRLKRLPNITLEEGSKTKQSHGADGTFQRSKTTVENDNGEFTLSISKWFSYQVDPTAYQRVKRSRAREEKKREEKSERPFLSKTETPEWM